ncbi:uncharacterized protein LOC133301270 [Gastrolobium bilobum]|uniref:uncharacterized protein LOC133301270 n=1 Tax=Gastrolobium bilobum TaxID=150636 RepID=UPI002AB2A7A3|nr:uncharacterized protein LOC133301270 [Gastrolobium bilobum]
MADSNAVQNPPRTLGDYMTPARVPQTTSIVRLTVDANNFELKPALFQLIQKDQFAGRSTKDPYVHLDNFLLYCDTLKMNGVSRDAILLRLFPCSLKDDARAWLPSLPEGSITHWDDLVMKFLARFFLASKMARFKLEITDFEQKESESLYEAWERFKGLLRKCPQHGIEAWERGRIFFQGMTPSTRTLVNAAAGGSLKTKTPEEALDLLESLASQEYDNAPVTQRRAGIMKLDGYDAILAQNEQILQINKKQQEQLDALTKQFNLSQISSVNNSQVKCSICADAHATEDCDYMRTTEKPPAEVNGIFYKSTHQLNPPLPLQQQPPPQENTSEWEKAFAQLSKTTSDYIQNADAFRDETRASFRNQEASIWNLETQIGQLLKQFTESTHGTFPSNTNTNPNAQCNSIVTRSGIVIQPVEKPPTKKKKEAEKEKEEDAGEAEKSSPDKKLFKWEKKKALDRQPKSTDLSPYARVHTLSC